LLFKSESKNYRMQKRSDKDYRKQISPQQLSVSIKEIEKRLYERLEEKGYGAWLSRHEILGFLTEEYYEVIEAVHNQSTKEIKEELKDIAVGCIFAMSCIDAKSLDW